MPAAVGTRSLPERALDVLRRAGNPFRNYFARNPDDERGTICGWPQLGVRHAAWL